MDIPDKITTAADAAQLLDDYVKLQTGPNPDLSTSWLVGWSSTGARARVASVLHGLDHDPGPGPAVSSQLRGSIGEPQPRAGSIFVVNEPDAGLYGVTIDDRADVQLAELAADITIVRALAARAQRCADADRAADRPRWAARWQHEADELISFAADLERHVEPIGAHVLDEIRAYVARRAPQQQLKPTPRRVQLR